jgi:hypothetical protein
VDYFVNKHMAIADCGLRISDLKGIGQRACGIESEIRDQLAARGMQQAISALRYSVGGSFACDLNDFNYLATFLEPSALRPAPLFILQSRIYNVS